VLRQADQDFSRFFVSVRVHARRGLERALRSWLDHAGASGTALAWEPANEAVRG
jgi:hypothetical protein